MSDGQLRSEQSDSQPFIWRGEELKTLGNMMDALGACTTAEEACEFRDAYRRVSRWADENLGYLTGYYDQARGQELRGWMQTAHPIFGMGNPSPVEAFVAGVGSRSMSPSDSSRIRVMGGSDSGPKAKKVYRQRFVLEIIWAQPADQGYVDDWGAAIGENLGATDPCIWDMTAGKAEELT